MDDLSKIAIHQAAVAAKIAWYDVVEADGLGYAEASKCALNAFQAIDAANIGNNELAQKHADLATGWRAATSASIAAQKASKHAADYSQDAETKQTTYISIVTEVRRQEQGLKQ